LREFIRLIALYFSPGKEYLRALIIRLFIFLLILCVSFSVFVIGLGFTVWASYLYLAADFSPPVAALLSASIAVLIACLLVLLGYLIISSASKREKTESGGTSSAILSDAANLVDQYPLQSSLAAVVLGFISGSSPESRKALSEILVLLNSDPYKQR